jgi:hypothetical protein
MREPDRFFMITVFGAFTLINQKKHIISLITRVLVKVWVFRLPPTIFYLIDGIVATLEWSKE